jgi:hypothetical protein
MEKKTGYQILSSVKDGILEIIITGEFTTSDIEKLQYKVADIIQAQGIKNLLVDARAINGPRIGIVENYTAVRRPFPNIPKVNVAIVDLPENADKGDFLETTAQNAGYSLKFFTDIDVARIWLHSKLR